MRQPSTLWSQASPGSSCPLSEKLPCMPGPVFWGVLALLWAALYEGTQFPCCQVNNSQLDDCLPCPTGPVCQGELPTQLWCPRGTCWWSPNGPLLLVCVLCPAGHHSAEPITATLRLCSPESFSEGLLFRDLCAPGHFCPPDTTESRQTPCPEGTWNSKWGAPDRSWCLPCPPGMFCATAGQATPSGPCAPGFFCPGGAQSPTPLAGPSDHPGPVRTCSEGSAVQGRQPDNGSGADASHCTGRVHNPGGGPCPPGHFCPAGTGLPLPCPLGTFSDRMFLSKPSECLVCPPGHFCGAPGLTAPSGPCSPGYFCVAGVSSPAPAGHWDHGGPCPQGHFCPLGTSLPQPCPAGSYSSLTGQASCFPCPAGHYCPEDTSSSQGHPCRPGFYCPPGTRYATQFPCPRGYYNPEPLAQSLDSCLPCPPGHYCGQENLTQASGPCDAGWFCLSAAWTARPFDLDNYTSAHCLCPATATGGKCPAGSFCPKGSPEPVPCPPGLYCAAAGLSTPSGPCQAGYYCAEGAVSPTPEDGVTGAPCPPGSFCSSGSSRPTSCPKGTFSNLPEQTAPSACQACPHGFYCEGTGLRAPSGPCPAVPQCQSCPSGYFCPPGTAQATRHSCPVGTYGPWEGLHSIAECQLCPAGKFCALAGLTAPTGDCAAGHWCQGGTTREDPVDSAQGRLCPSGHYCLLGAATPAPCPLGTWSEEGNADPGGCHDGEALCSAGQLGVACLGTDVPATLVEGDLVRLCTPRHVCPLQMAQPVQCPPGSYATGAHAQKCHPCPHGYYCVPQKRPQLCPRGFYCPEGTGLDWQPCPPGTYGLAPGSSDLKGCRACDPGRFCPGHNATEPGGQCWEGFFCSGGSTQPNPEAGTEDGAGPCPRGHYCPRGSALPQPCPPGTLGVRRKLSSEAACSPCPPGHYCSSPGLSSPSGPCHMGFFCLGGAQSPNGSLASHSGGPCPEGHFCPLGTATPRPCPAGTYNSLVAQGHCAPCPQGFFCPPSASSLSGNECPAGHYCPAATSSASQFPCPRGTYRPHTGGVRPSDCTPCEPGTYCLRPGLTATSGPCAPGFHCTQGASVPNPTDRVTGDLCPQGHFCPQGSPRPTPCPLAASLEDCQPCPAGWFCSRPGLSSPEALCEGGWFCPAASISGYSPGTRCSPGYACPPGSPEPQLCPAGQYQDEPGQRVCKACPAGKFCPSGILASGARPIWPVDCPAGHFCPVGTQTPSQHPCPRGTFRERPGARSSSDCRTCPAGLFCSESGTGRRLPDGPCSSGYYCPPGQTSATPVAFRCPRGFHCPVGSAHPRACAEGTFQPQEAQGFCEPCPAGSYCPATHSVKAQPCPRGTFRPRQGATIELDCELCPAGMFCASEGLSEPSGPCHAAHYCTGGALSPTPFKHQVDSPVPFRNDICPPGFFCPQGTGSPLPCPPGSYSSVPGLTQEDQCQPCPPGHFCNHAGLCATGFHCPPGVHFKLPCEPGTFSPLPRAAICLPCPRGTYCSEEATVEPSTCPRGHYCPLGTSSARPCPEGMLSARQGAHSPRTCQPCPAGRYCPGEGNWQPEGACQAGYFCEGGASRPTPHSSSAFPLNGPCPTGHYCPLGTVQPVPCPAGTLRASPGGMSQGSCDPCPVGSFCPGLGPVPASCMTGSERASDTITSSSMAFPCPQGHFCPPGAVQPYPCPLGQYQPTQGSDVCLPCPAGSHCPHLGTQRAQPCPAHSYCPSGTGPPPLCPPGTFTPQDASGLQEQGDCSLCPPGHYCRAGQVWGRCPAGYFCPPGTADLQSPCPPGLLCAQQCPPGFYCSEGSVPSPCPPHTMTTAPGATQREDCRPCPPGHWCRAGLPAGRPCPAGHFCPGGSGRSPGGPQPCPKHTYLATEGAWSLAECLPCPAGYHCQVPGLSSFEGHPCPPGHWCPGGQGAIPCPPGTLRPESGASSQQDCVLCPAGHFCPAAEWGGPVHVLAMPCREGTECPAGAVAERPCRAGSFCRPQTGVPPPCPGGYACPEGSSTYTGPGQRCLFPHYCPLGSAQPQVCPGGTEATRGNHLRDSQETGCRVCQAGTFHSGIQVAQPCQPCPPGFSCPPGTESYTSWPCPAGHYCPQGTLEPRPCPPGSFGNHSGAGTVEECAPCPAETFSAWPGQTSCLPCGSVASSVPGVSQCTCQGLNRVFHKSDGSCICQAGHGCEDDDSEESSGKDCQPLVAERCASGDVRLASTRTCVSPRWHDCSAFCHPNGGELNSELGICQCQGYVPAEELCDATCLLQASLLSVTRGPKGELLLGLEGDPGYSAQKEVTGTLGPDPFFGKRARAYLVQCSPYGLLGMVVFTEEAVASFLHGPLAARPPLERLHGGTVGPDGPSPSHIRNPVVCLEVGDVILFQLQLLPHNRTASHYPVYQRQHLFNSNPRWDSGAFRRLGLLVREGQRNVSRFAHQFHEPGTYVFQDNGLPESVAVVLVREPGTACPPGLYPIQPLSPRQLQRLGIHRHQVPNTAPDWAAITGVLLAVGLATVLLTGLGLVLRPMLPPASPAWVQESQWRALGRPHMLVDNIPRSNSASLHKGIHLWGPKARVDSWEAVTSPGTGYHPPEVPGRLRPTLEDLSVRTLYDKLEDQSLHVAAQLSQHRRDTLAFYRRASQQLQELQDLLRSCSPPEPRALGSSADPGRGAGAAGHSKNIYPRRSWPKGATTLLMPTQGFQPNLDKVLADLASALSHMHSQTAMDGRKGSALAGDQPPSSSQWGPCPVTESVLKNQPVPSDEETLSASTQQDPGSGWSPQCDARRDTKVPSSGKQFWGAMCRQQIFPELQRKIQQVEEALDELNEEFFQVTVQALELQEDEAGRPPPRDGEVVVEAPSDFPWVLQSEQTSPTQAPSPAVMTSGTWHPRSDRALVLEVRRAHLHQRIGDLEWELSLLLQVAGSRPSARDHPQSGGQ